MASPSASTPSLSPTHSQASSSSPSSSSSSSSPPFLQPDYFFNLEQDECDTPAASTLSPSPGRYLSPDDDPVASRGVPVFKPSLDEFNDFEGYMNKVEPWGFKSGVVKIIPPKEWIDSLPAILPQLQKVHVNSPIEQQMLGRSGLYRQQNIERRKWMSVREWAELCAKEELRTPGIDDVSLKVAEADAPPAKKKGKGRKKELVMVKTEDVDVSVDEEPLLAVQPQREESPLTEMDDLDQALASDEDFDNHDPSALSEHISGEHPGDDDGQCERDNAHDDGNDGEPDKEDTPACPAAKQKVKRKSRARFSKPKPKAKTPRPMRFSQTRAGRALALERRERLDDEFFAAFDPVVDWLPPNTSPHDYTNEFCAKLERKYWRNVGLGRAAWYGADSSGTLFTPETSMFNLSCLPSTLSRLLPSSAGLPGVNSPYLYFGMWKATFAWHVEDMDLHSINYLHFGAPKFWYAMPQGKAAAFENVMRSYFPRDTSLCPQFLRHKSFLASPRLLADSSCRPLCVVQHAGEFVVTFPRGYHAGFNLGFNCAEAVNFATERWVDIGRKAAVCMCVGDSVRIDVEELVRAQEEGRNLDEEIQAEETKPRMNAGGRMKRRMTTVDLGSAIGDENSPPKRRRVHIKAEPDVGVISLDHPSSSNAVPATSHKPRITLKLPAPPPLECLPCCLCVSESTEGLLRVWKKPSPGSGCTNIGSEVDKEVWRAHEECARVIPETWVEQVEVGVDDVGVVKKENIVFGVDLIVKARWNLRCTVCPKSKHKHKLHGAKVQCTKGKCSKAFHVSCAKEGGTHAQGIKLEKDNEDDGDTALSPMTTTADHVDRVGQLNPTTDDVDKDPKESRIVWRVLGEVDVDVGSGRVGEVVEVVTPPKANIGAEDEMDVDGVAERYQVTPVELQQASIQASAYGTSSDDSTALPTFAHPTKMVKKLKVELLCTQHSPITAAAKRANKSNRLRSALLALPNMSRIKVRVQSGVFEVSLVRVIEDHGSVEVLWDGGQPREFKWSSVVLKEKDGEVVGQKPDVMAEPVAREPTKSGKGKKEKSTTAVARTTGGQRSNRSKPPPTDLSSSHFPSPVPTPVYYAPYAGGATSGQYPYGGGITYHPFTYPPYQQPYAHLPYAVAGPNQSYASSTLQPYAPQVRLPTGDDEAQGQSSTEATATPCQAALSPTISNGDSLNGIDPTGLQTQTLTST